MNKYGAKRTYSQLCNRIFDSRAECLRGEELRLLEMAGEIMDLEYQVRFILSQSPRVTITVDFSYREKGKLIYEDSKGVLTRDFRTKMAWLKSSQGIDVTLTGGRR